MEDIVYLFLALGSLLVVLLTRRGRRTSADGEDKLRLPPGPWTLPVIGSMHHIAGALPHRAMRDLARRHGWPVMLLRLGEVPTLVVSSREGAREVLKTHDAAFATRALSSTVRVLTNGGRDIVFAPYGEHWRQMRKIAVTELLTSRRVLSFRAIREEEVGAMLRSVASAAGNGDVIDMRARLSALVADSTLRAVMGDRCNDRDVFLRELDRSIGLAGGFNPADLWPSSRLAVWASGAVRRAEECRDTVFGILDGIIAQHQQRMGTADGDDEDLIDVLLRVQNDGSLPLPLDMDAIKGVIFVIFGAGSETSATTLEWIIAELVKNPKVMHRATAEVRRAFEAGGKVQGGASAAGVDFRGADFELLPFGAGRRMCPGMAFGLANVELALASLLLHFDWEAPGVADPAEFDMTEAFGITARRKAGLLLRPVLRVPVRGV
ncbi:unnamed protein product [Triticum turgidum subsp. durum]|uniref:Cytochrome P450 n=1 Tax=Triticum turgidum subsp. durum TaxID=4567 RepID=A0A9R1AER8_TRITD|nr:unnamed protein product [Triticum turgidum subsp. durum]